MIGFSDTKRKIAISLGVDPYSTNAVLQKELDGISWAAFAGGMVFKVGTIPSGGGAGAALTVTGVTKTFDDVLREKNPSDLKMMNRKILLEMGASSADTEKFPDNGAFSASAQTAFALNLRALEGVSNRGAFVRLAAKSSSSEADAISCVQTAKLMGTLHKGDKPLARIAVLGGFPDLHRKGWERDRCAGVGLRGLHTDGRQIRARLSGVGKGQVSRRAFWNRFAAAPAGAGKSRCHRSGQAGSRPFEVSRLWRGSA